MDGDGGTGGKKQMWSMEIEQDGIDQSESKLMANKAQMEARSNTNQYERFDWKTK